MYVITIAVDSTISVHAGRLLPMGDRWSNHDQAGEALEVVDNLVREALKRVREEKQWAFLERSAANGQS